MIKFRYNHKKNAELLFEQNTGFEAVIQSITDGNLLDVKLHHNQGECEGQKILYVRMIDQVYAVPYVQENEDSIFLKTLFLSRKAKKEFLKK